MSKLDAIVVFSTHAPEPERAAWIETELRARGLEVGTYRYTPDSGDRLEELYNMARHIVVLFSVASVQTTGQAFVEAYLSGRKPLPVSCENHSKYAPMADLAHVCFFGVDPSADKKQLDKVLVKAIQR